jgi:hypothetical protein
MRYSARGCCIGQKKVCHRDLNPAESLLPIGNTSAPMLGVPSGCRNLATISEGNRNQLDRNSWSVPMAERIISELSDTFYETMLTLCGASCVASLLLAGTI